MCRQKLTLSPETIEAEIGEEIQLYAFIFPENATDKSLAWQSDDESVATVDDNGLVTVYILSNGKRSVKIAKH